MHTLNLLANETQILKDFTLSDADDVLQHTYTVEITEGYLTQVIFTPKDRVRHEDEWGRRDHFWIWNGSTIEQVFKLLPKSKTDEFKQIRVFTGEVSNLADRKKEN